MIMSKLNQIRIVREIYKIYPNITDVDIAFAIGIIAKVRPMLSTIRAYKVKVRKEGISIPDKRRKKEEK